MEHEQSWDSDEDLELDHLDGTMRWLSYRLTPDLVDEYMLKLEELGSTPAIESPHNAFKSEYLNMVEVIVRSCMEVH